MTETAIRLLNVLLPIAYALSVAAYALEFFRADRLAGRVARRTMELALALHASYLGLLTARYAHVPLASTAELLTTVAFAAAATYVFVERRSGVGSTGAFVVSFSFMLQTLSSAFIEPSASFPELLRSPLFAAHTVAAVLGYTAFAVSAVYGALYLTLHWDLKRSHFGLVYDRLPPLETLARMSLRAALFGVAFLTATIAIGSSWAAARFPGFSRDPKFLLTLAVWSIYVCAVWLHYGRQWSGRRAIRISLGGFSVLVLAVLASRLLFASFHVFA
ncbi:MAG: inner membrane protein YpjD [Vicinamibacteria bacterium]